jgi:hypothetical protein
MARVYVCRVQEVGGVLGGSDEGPEVSFQKLKIQGWRVEIPSSWFLDQLGLRETHGHLLNHREHY